MLRFSGKKNPRRREVVEQEGMLRTGAEQTATATFQEVELPVHRFRKSVDTFAVRMDEAYIVDTLEGPHDGKAGSYLAIGAHGELYPIDAEIFEETYELVEEEG